MTDSEKLFLFQAIQQADRWRERYKQALNLKVVNQRRVNELRQNYQDAEEILDDLIYTISREKHI